MGKKRLAVFDFDKTIADFSVDIDGEIEAHKILFADGQIPSDFKDLKTDLNAGNAVRSYKIKTLNERNLTKDQVWNIFEQIDEESRALIEGMDKVLKYLYEDHDIILLSDNDTLTPSVFLSRYGLLKYFSDLSARKMTIAQDGQLSFEDIPRTSSHLVVGIYARDKYFWIISRTKTMKKCHILVMEEMIIVLQQNWRKVTMCFQEKIFL